MLLCPRKEVGQVLYELEMFVKPHRPGWGTYSCDYKSKEAAQVGEAGGL